MATIMIHALKFLMLAPRLGSGMATDSLSISNLPPMSSKRQRSSSQLVPWLPGFGAGSGGRGWNLIKERKE